MFSTTTRIQRLQDLVKQDGFNQLAHYMLGEEYLKENRPMEAAAKFRRIVEMNPDHADAWNLMGQAYEKADAIKESIAAFGSAIRQYEMLGKNDQAEKMRENVKRLSAVPHF